MIFKIEWFAFRSWTGGPLDCFDIDNGRTIRIPRPCPLPETVSGPAYVRANSCFEALQRFGAWYESEGKCDSESDVRYRKEGYTAVWHLTIKSVEEVPGQLIV